MNEIEWDQGGRPRFIKSIKGGVGVAFLLFKRLLICLLTCLFIQYDTLPIMQAMLHTVYIYSATHTVYIYSDTLPIMQAMQLYMRGCLYVPTWSAFCLCLHALRLFNRLMHCAVYGLLFACLIIGLLIACQAITVPGAYWSAFCLLVAYLIGCYKSRRLHDRRSGHTLTQARKIMRYTLRQVPC